MESRHTRPESELDESSSSNALNETTPLISSHPRKPKPKPKPKRLRTVVIEESDSASSSSPSPSSPSLRMGGGKVERPPLTLPLRIEVAKPREGAQKRQWGPLDMLSRLLNRWVHLVEGYQSRREHKTIRGFLAQFKSAHDDAYPFTLPWNKHNEEEIKKQAALKLLDSQQRLRGVLEDRIALVKDFQRKLLQIHETLENTRKRINTEKEADIKTQVQRIFERLSVPLKEKFREYEKIKQAHEDSLRVCFKQFMSLKTAQPWIEAEWNEITSIEDVASSLLEQAGESQKANALLVLSLPKGLQNVELSSPSQSKQKDFEGLQAEITQTLLTCQAACEALIEGEVELERWLKGRQKDLLELRTQYNMAREEYLLQRACIDSFHHRRTALAHEVDELLCVEASKENQTKDSILQLLRLYLSDENNAASDVKRALEEHFTSKDKTINEFQEKLKNLTVRMQQYSQDVGVFENGITQSDKNYNKLSLFYTAIWQAEKKEEQRQKKFKDTLKQGELSDKKVVLEGRLKEIDQLYANATLVLEKAKIAEKESRASIESRLKLMINEDVITLNVSSPGTSAEHFSGVLDRLESEINELTCTVGASEKLTANLNATIERLDAVKKASLSEEERSAIAESIHNSASDLKIKIANHDEQVKSDELRLTAVKKECDSYVAEHLSRDEIDKLLHRVALIRLSENLFCPPLEELVSKFSELSWPALSDDSSASINEAFGKDLVESYETIRKKNIAINNHLKIHFPGLSGKGQSARQFLKALQEHFDDITGSTEIRNAVTDRTFRKYEDDYKNLDWENGGVAALEKESVEAMRDYPRARVDQVDSLFGKRQILFSEKDDSLETLLAAARRNLAACTERLDKHLQSLQVIKSNISDYLELHKLFINQALYFGETIPGIETKMTELCQRKNFLAGELESVNRCLFYADEIIGAETVINNARKEINGNLVYLKIADLTKKVDKQQENLRQKAKYKKDTFALFENISTFKRMKQSSFVRLSREFLFAGKSCDIIKQLSLHRLSRYNTPKGRCIAEFLDKLMEHRFGSLSELQAYLDCPFGVINGLSDPRNEQLFANTGWSNLGGAGRPSTTKRLISELRQELLLLEERELAAHPRSIAYALGQDGRQIESEFASILNVKGIGDQAPTAEAAQLCEEMIEKYVSMQNPPDPANTTKLQRSLIGIQYWDPMIKNATTAPLVQMRYIRMQCAEAILLDSAKQQQLKADHPDVYLYQELCLHLEGCATKRLAEKSQIVACLDNILFGSDIPTKKYESMLNALSGYYTAIRHSFNGSESYFFGEHSFFSCGKGSRLGDALEVFLKKYRDVSHRREAKGLDAAAEWLSKNIFTCGGSP